MAKCTDITVTVKGLETKEDKDYFIQKCAEFWMEIISQKISELPMSHERKVEYAKEIVSEIKRKKVR